MDRRLFFLLHRAERALFAYARANVEEHLGTTVAQMTALLYVSKHPGCSMTELADLLDLNKSAVTGLVQRMERAGTLRREPNPEDGRGNRLFTTAKGESLKERAKPLIRRVNQELTKGFSEAETETILRFLSSVITRYSTDPREEQP